MPRQLREAYYCLINPETRATYDSAIATTQNVKAMGNQVAELEASSGNEDGQADPAQQPEYLPSAMVKMNPMSTAEMRLAIQKGCMEKREARLEKAAKERQEKEAAREARLRILNQATSEKKLQNVEHLTTDHDKQAKLWTDLKADTPEAKKQSCLHAHALVWPKQKHNRKFK